MLVALVNKVDPVHVESVKAEMVVLGAPKIKAVWMECFGHWAALDGSHRVVAAYELGLVPEIEEIEYSEEVTIDDLGCDDSGDCATVSSICDNSYSASFVKFED